MNQRGTEGTTPARQVTVRDFVAVLFRRKWVILGVFAVTTAVTAGVILSQPTYYESTGKVLVKRGVRDNLLQSYHRTLSWEEELSSEVETARSPAVVRRAQKILDERRRGNGQEPYTIDPGRADATVVGESNVIAISYQDLIPEICTEVTSALLTAYMEFRQDTYTLPYPGEFFDTEIAQVQEELSGLQQQRRQYLSQSRIADVANERIHLLNERTMQSNTETELNRELAEMRAQLVQMEDYLLHPENYPDIPFRTSQFTGGERVIADLKLDVIEKKVRLSELQRVYQPGVPEIRRLEQEITELEKMLKQEVDSRIELARLEVSTKEARLRETRNKRAEIDNKLAALPYQEARLADLDRRLEAYEENYQDLVRDAERAKVNQATSTDRTVFILAPASFPYPKNTKDYVRIALAPIFSLIVGLGLAFFVDSLDTTVKNAHEAEEALDLPVLATLTDQRKSS